MPPFLAATADTSDGVPGGLAISGGYWSFTLDELPDLDLTISLSGGAIRLMWDTIASPVILENSTDLKLWTPVNPQPGGPPYIEARGVRRFYDSQSREIEKELPHRFAPVCRSEDFEV